MLDFLDKHTVGSRLPKSAILTAPGVNLKISGTLKIINKRNVFSLVLYQPCFAQKV